MRNAKKYILLLIIVFICIISLFFSPKKILNIDDDIRIEAITYNPQFVGNEKGTKQIEIIEYDEKKIIECLSRYKTLQTLSRNIGYQIKDVEYEIHINVNGISKYIILGNINYECYSYGKFRRRVLKSEKLKEELYKIFDFQKRKEI